MPIVMGVFCSCMSLLRFVLVKLVFLDQWRRIRHTFVQLKVIIRVFQLLQFRFQRLNGQLLARHYSFCSISMVGRWWDGRRGCRCTRCQCGNIDFWLRFLQFVVIDFVSGTDGNVFVPNFESVEFFNGFFVVLSLKSTDLLVLAMKRVENLTFLYETKP